MPILGASCALNGYYYGTGRPAPPALSELLEQAVRFLLCMRLVAMLRGWPMTLRAAIPAAAALAGETAGLLFMLALCAPTLLAARGEGSRRALIGEMTALALPLTGMKLVSSLMRTVNAVLIPARLQISGLSAAESLARLGMLQGMAMPVLMMPSFITCSVSMVAAPELTRRQAAGKPLRALAMRVLLSTLGVGLLAGAAVYALAPVFAGTLYRQAELLPLLRGSCALVPVMALTHVVSGMMNALGMQRMSLRISLVSSLLSVLTACLLAALPAVRLWGAVAGIAAAQLVTLGGSLLALREALAR